MVCKFFFYYFFYQILDLSLVNDTFFRLGNFYIWSKVYIFVYSCLTKTIIKHQYFALIPCKWPSSQEVDGYMGSTVQHLKYRPWADCDGNHLPQDSWAICQIWIVPHTGCLKGEQGSKSILEPCVYWENTNHFSKMRFVSW